MRKLRTQQHNYQVLLDAERDGESELNFRTDGRTK